MKRTGTRDSYRNWNKSMPVLMISGMSDPVGDMGKGVRQVLAQMRRAGMSNVQMQLYPHARHDVLHEENLGAARDARDLIFRWLISNNERSANP